MDKWIKALISVAGGAIAAFSRQYCLIIVFVVMVVVFDFATGIVKCKITGTGVDSGTARKGFWKKVALFVALFFGFFLDFFIPYALNYIAIELPIKTALFGMIVGCYIVINEAISICENLYACNPNIIPRWIAKMLTRAKDTMDKQGDDRNEQSDN